MLDASAVSETALRSGSVQRKTKETRVDVSISLDGTGVCDSKSGIPFLDHMMDVRCSKRYTACHFLLHKKHLRRCAPRPNIKLV